MPVYFTLTGNVPSPNDPQGRFTTTNLEYLVSQTIPNFRILRPGLV